jgi:RNA polymerase sigma-70 factor (family 1)
MQAVNIAELIETLKRGDPRSFQKIYDEFYPPLLGFAKKFVDEANAKDIVIDKFAKLWERRADFEDMSYVKSFLYFSVRNACLNSLKSWKRRQRFEKLYTLFVDSSESSIEEAMIFADVMQEVYAEIKGLSPQLKRIFILKYIRGFKNPIIAKKLDISVQNVRNQYNQACKQLRIKLLKRNPDIL